MTDPHPKDTNDAIRYPDAWAGHVLDRAEPDVVENEPKESDRG